MNTKNTIRRIFADYKTVLDSSLTCLTNELNQTTPADQAGLVKIIFCNYLFHNLTRWRPLAKFGYLSCLKTDNLSQGNIKAFRGYQNYDKTNSQIERKFLNCLPAILAYK